MSSSLLKYGRKEEGNSNCENPSVLTADITHRQSFLLSHSQTEWLRKQQSIFGTANVQSLVPISYYYIYTVCTFTRLAVFLTANGRDHIGKLSFIFQLKFIHL